VGVWYVKRMRAHLGPATVTLAATCALGCDRGHAAVEAPAPSDVHAASLSTSPRGFSASSAPRAGVRCAPDPAYPTVWQLAEASAAVEIEPRPGERAILALADSDNHGEGMIWPIAPPGPLRAVKLELDGHASDDIEGAAWRDGHLYTLTSSGGVRRYTPGRDGDLREDRGAYPIGPPAYLCGSLFDGNCGKDFEGLCLRPSSKKAPHCAGYAASRADGALFCVVVRGDALAIDPLLPPLTLAVPHHALSDCAFGSAGGPAEDALVVTTNVYGGSATYLVDEATGALSAIDVPGTLNNEAVAVDRSGALYQFMDGNTSVSPSARATCSGWPVADVGRTP
jgi:hypothetical protein